MKRKIGMVLFFKAFLFIVIFLSFFFRGTFYRGIPPSASPISGESILLPFLAGMAGHASWYGEDFHGRITSSGEIYDMYAYTAAHRTLPLGSKVRVRNLNNGKTVDVRITDRGPFWDNRIIDLSYSSAKEIEILTQGVAMVRLTLLKQSASARNPVYLKPAGSLPPA